MQIAERLELEKRKCNVMLTGVRESEEEGKGKEVVHSLLRVLGVE